MGQQTHLVICFEELLHKITLLGMKVALKWSVSISFVFVWFPLEPRPRSWSQSKTTSSQNDDDDYQMSYITLK